MSADELVSQAGCAAFSCGPGGKITAWNEEAEDLLAAWASTTVGEPCHKVVKGLDAFGNSFCSKHCACWAMAQTDQLIRPFRLSVRDGRSRRFDVQVMILTAKSPHDIELVHLLEPVNSGQARTMFNQRSAAGPALNGASSRLLNQREKELLRHLADGSGTEVIGQSMGISPIRVRNQVARCLHKLDAQSRIEAVSVARRRKLV